MSHDLINIIMRLISYIYLVHGTKGVGLDPKLAAQDQA